VLVVHPSPVNTGFYAGNTAGLDAPKFFRMCTFPLSLIVYDADALVVDGVCVCVNVCVCVCVQRKPLVRL
jgi:hypothetical protein